MLLARYEGNPPVTSGFSSQGASNMGFDILFDDVLNRLLDK